MVDANSVLQNSVGNNMVCHDKFIKFKTNKHHSKSDKVLVACGVTQSMKTLSRRLVAIHFCS